MTIIVVDCFKFHVALFHCSGAAILGSCPSQWQREAPPSKPKQRSGGDPIVRLVAGAIGEPSNATYRPHGLTDCTPIVLLSKRF